MLKKLIFILFFSTISEASELRTAIVAKLPEDLRNLNSKSKEADLRQMYKGKIVSSQNTALFLNYFGDDCDVTIGLKNGYFSYLYIILPHDLADKFSSFKSFALEEGGLSSLGADRRIHIKNAALGLNLEFAATGAQELRAIYLNAADESAP